MAERVMIRNWQAPGDFTVLSAAIRDISLAYPRRYEFGIEVPNKDVFANNPYIKPIPLNGARRLQAKYPLIHQSNQNRFHFCWGFLDYLNKQLGVKAPLTELRPDLHLTPAEKASPPAYVKKPYWVYASGGKTDYTAKWWDPMCWQQVVKLMAPKYQMVQVGGASHKHPKIMESIPNTVDMVGKTSLRELMRLIYHADGVLSIVTSLMHIAAAFNKPAVTIAGGREPWWWEAYTLENREFNLKVGNPGWQRPENDSYIPHRYLHTIGELACCKTGGCWKSKADRGTNNKGGSICVLPVLQNGVKLPRCLQAITPEMVVANAEWYYREGIISPERTLISIPVECGSAVLVPVDGRTLPAAPALPEQPKPREIKRFEPAELAAPLGNVNVFAYCEDADQEAMYTENCILNSNGLPSSFSFTKLLNSGGTRADYMRKALELCTGTWLVWLEAGVRLKPGWFERLSALGTSEILGISYWHPLRAADVTQIVRAPWYREVKYEEHRTEGRTWRTTHPGEKFFAAPVEFLKQAGWPFSDKPAVYLGAAMKQQDFKITNACELLETA